MIRLDRGVLGEEMLVSRLDDDQPVYVAPREDVHVAVLDERRIVCQHRRWLCARTLDVSRVRGLGAALDCGLIVDKRWTDGYLVHAGAFRPAA